MNHNLYTQVDSYIFSRDTHVCRGLSVLEALSHESFAALRVPTLCMVIDEYVPSPYTFTVDCAVTGSASSATWTAGQRDLLQITTPPYMD